MSPSPEGNSYAGQRRPPIKLAVLLVIASEMMLFAGFISAFVVFRAGNLDWPPVGQPRLPVAATALNTAFLLISGILVWISLGRARAGKKFSSALGAAVALGVLFVLLQGREWAQLLSQGLGLANNPYGGFFYIIIGMHALHVIVAVLAGVYVYPRSAAGTYSKDKLDGLVAFSYFWAFVVLLWPPLYFMVYLW